MADGELCLEVPKNNCPDMRGAIEIATAIMPSVFRIVVVCDGEIDVVYHGPCGEWKAYDYRSYPKQRVA